MPKSYTNEYYFPVWVKPRNKQQLSRYVDSKINKDPKVLLQLKTSMSYSYFKHVMFLILHLQLSH
jgi:hypothetical protein